MAIILDVKTPICCFSCPCYDGDDGSSMCNDAERNVDDGDARPNWCPICGELFIDPEEIQPSVAFEIDVKAMEDSILHTSDKWAHSGTIRIS